MLKETYIVPENATVVVNFGYYDLPIVYLSNLEGYITNTIQKLYIDTISEDELDFGEKGEVRLQLEKFEAQDEYSKIQKPEYKYLGEYLMYKGKPEPEDTEDIRGLSTFNFDLVSSLLNEDAEDEISFAVPIFVDYIVAKAWITPDGMNVYCAFIEADNLQNYQKDMSTNDTFSIKLTSNLPTHTFFVKDQKIGFEFHQNPEYFGFNTHELPVELKIYDDTSEFSYATLNPQIYQTVLTCTQPFQAFEIQTPDLIKTYRYDKPFILIRVSNSSDKIRVELAPLTEDEAFYFDSNNKD